MVLGCLNQSQAYAIESQSFVLHCTSALTDAGIELMKTNGGPIVGASRNTIPTETLLIMRTLSRWVTQFLAAQLSSVQTGVF